MFTPLGTRLIELKREVLVKATIDRCPGNEWKVKAIKRCPFQRSPDRATNGLAVSSKWVIFNFGQGLRAWHGAGDSVLLLKVISCTRLVVDGGPTLDPRAPGNQAHDPLRTRCVSQHGLLQFASLSQTFSTP